MKKHLFFFAAMIIISCNVFAIVPQTGSRFKPGTDRSVNPHGHHGSLAGADVFKQIIKGSLIKDASTFCNWDTIISYDTTGGLERYTATLDNDGNILIFTRQLWSGGTWTNNWKQTFTYGANRYVHTELNEAWQGGAWVNSSRRTFTFDGNGNQVSELDEAFQSNAWVNNMRYTDTFDANRNLLSDFSEIWNNNSWGNYMLWTNTYDASNNLITTLGQFWVSGAWENQMMYIQTYDTGNHMLSEQYQEWQAGAWVNSYLVSYTNDPDGNILTELYQIWQSNAWENYTYTIYTYNSSGRCTYLLAQMWDTGAWADNQNCQFSYDANGNKLAETWQKWSSNAWENYIRYSYTYDANGNSITGKFEEASSGIWHKAVGSLSLYSRQLWLMFMSGAYEYTAHFQCFDNTGIENKQETLYNLIVYPDPTSGMVTISLCNFNKDKTYQMSLFNFQGKEILQRSLKDDKTEFDISYLPSGVYLLKITDGQSYISKKIMKK